MAPARAAVRLPRRHRRRLPVHGDPQLDGPQAGARAPAPASSCYGCSGAWPSCSAAGLAAAPPSCSTPRFRWRSRSCSRARSWPAGTGATCQWSSAVALLALADLLSHLESLRALPTDMMGDRLAIAVVTALVALIGGRITPSFTTNWLKERGAVQPPAPSAGSTALSWCSPSWPCSLGSFGRRAIPSPSVAGRGCGAAVRLARWRGAATTREPLLLVLHLGYAWLALGLTLLGLAALGLCPAGCAACTDRRRLRHHDARRDDPCCPGPHRPRAHRRRLDDRDLCHGQSRRARPPRLHSGRQQPTCRRSSSPACCGRRFLTYAFRYGPILLGPNLAPGAPVGAPGGRVTGSRSPA